MQGDFEYGQLEARVLELEQRLDFLYRRLGVHYGFQADADEQAIADALRSGGALEAIKVYRAMHNVDLASAKQAVETVKARLGL
jgi:hypothetical protein